MKRLIALFFLIIPFMLRAEPSEEVRKKYAEQIYAAFQLQSEGRSTMAFYAFGDAYQTAIKNGESPSKLVPFDALFRWYRQYGYSSGVTKVPSGCIDEYLSPGSSRKKLDPNQEKMVRDFLYGVGELVSGTFCLVIKAPLSSKAGWPLVVNGCRLMFDSVSSMIKDYEERKQRLKELDGIYKMFEKSFPKN